MKNIILPSNILWAAGKEFCETTLYELRNKKVLLITSSSTLSRLALEKWLRSLKESSSLTWLEEIPSNPTYLDVYSSLKKIKDITPDIVLAIGGGSTIDLAKSLVGLSYLNKNYCFSADDVLNCIKAKEYNNHNINTPIFAVPTTAGTGSEVTQWATVWDNKEKLKYSIDAAHLRPKRAYIIPEFTLTMPKRLTLSTGLDAFCQAIEAYWARTSDRIVKELSKVAIRLINEYLPKVLAEPENLYFREKMCLASLFSGLAFSNTRTTACHSISYPLTLEYGIEHGLACAMSLAKVMEINITAIDEVNGLFDALGVKKAHEVQEWLDRTAGGIVELRLSFFGVRKRDIPKLVGMSFTLGRMDNNPVPITPVDVERILTAIL